MQAIRRIAKRKSIKAVSVPQEFGDTVEIIVLPVKLHHSEYDRLCKRYAKEVG